MSGQEIRAAEASASYTRRRRQLRDQVRAMTEAELIDAMFTDSATGLFNRRAFERGYSQVVAIVDLDSLKWTNDHEGHAAGDELLRMLAAVLVDELGPEHVYRLAGDEYAVRANSAVHLIAALKRARIRFPGFSFGVGRDLPDADGALRAEKARREVRGERAPRGERPPSSVRRALEQLAVPFPKLPRALVHADRA